jgi:molecular chaperone GrpE
MKNRPINIPIESDDDDALPSDLNDADDVIEIDGDAVDVDGDLADIEAEIETAAPAAASDEASDGDAESSRPKPDETPTVEVDPIVELEDADFDPVVVPEAAASETAPDVEAAPKPPEISREAVFEMMTELRQKTEQITRLVDEKNDLYDKLLRKQAEFENFRKRGEREMQEAYLRARADLVTDLLPIVDNFDLAMHHAENAGADVLHEGVQLIHKQFMDTLARFGLDAIDAGGQPFDPELHEAVATEESDEVPDHTVVYVLQRGFKLGDRMLRPARVKVAVQPDVG